MSARVKLAAVIALTLVMAALLTLHLHGVNGPWYWKWPWRRLSALWLFPAMLIAAGPFFAGQHLFGKNPKRVGRALALITLSALALQLAAISLQPPAPHRLSLLVQNSVNTSYYTSAKILYDQQNISITDWLEIFPSITPMLMIHARYKPPGLILFYYGLMKLFGPGDGTALLGGIIIAICAAAAVPMTYLLLRGFGAEPLASFCGASFIAMTPSLILFLPQFDQVYVPIGCALLLAWRASMQTPNHRRAAMFAAGFGAILAMGLFMSYIFLVLGAFLAAYTLMCIADTQGKILSRAVTLSIVVIATVVLLYAILWSATGFNAIETFEALSRVQAADLIPLIRPFPQHIFYDVLDLAMGTGWISFLLIAFYLALNAKKIFTIFRQSSEHRLVFLAMLQIIVTALAALLPGETARLWMLLIPLLIAPIAFELATWPHRTRMGVYLCLWLLLTLICQNMIFLYMGPEIDGAR